VEWIEPPWAGQAAADEWFRAWIGVFTEFAVDALVIVCAVVLALAIVSWYGVTYVRRRFWCRLVDRDVEVEFAKRGPFRRLAAVARCPAFEDGTAISCARRCLDPGFRGQWQPALSVRPKALISEAP
jgi:hypothetical protein